LGAAAVVIVIVIYYINVLFHLPFGKPFEAPPSPYFGGFLALVLLYFLYVAFTGSFAIWDAAVGADGRASTSKFQVFVWTIVVIFGYVAVVTHRVQLLLPPGMPGFPETVLLALGISIGTATAAAAVTSSNLNTGRDVKVPTSNQGLAPIFQSDDNMPSLSKIQLVAWTAIGVGVFLTQLAGVLTIPIPAGGSATDIAPLLVLPDIDQTLLVLMGLGSAAYLGTKLVPSTAVQVGVLSTPTVKAGSSVTINGMRFGSTGFVQIGDAEVHGGLTWSDTAVTVKIPLKKPDDSDWAFGTPLDVTVFGSNGKSVNSVPLTINPKE